MKSSDTTPLSVTFFTISVLSFTFWNMLRVYGAIINWQVLSEFKASPLYILSTGLMWVFAGAGLFILIRRKNSQTLRAIMVVAGLYYLWYWCDRLIVQASPSPNGVFSSVISTTILLIFLVVTNTRVAKSYFIRGKHERES